MRSPVKSPSRVLLWAVAILTAAIYAAMPYSGDDYAYKAVWHYPTIIDAILHYPGYILHHWLRVNGRLANLIASPLFNLAPKWLIAAMCGAATWLMLYMALRWAGVWRRHAFAGTVLITTVMLAFPWWDAMQIFDCQFNYVWASALTLAGVWLITRPTDTRGWRLAGACAVAAAGGMMHESATLPLLAGGAVWWWMHRRLPWPSGRKAVMWSYVAGGAIALASPGILGRAGHDAIPNDTLPLLFVKSFAIVGVLWVCMAVAAMWPKGRRAMKEMLSTPLVILAVATVPAVVIGLKSGIVGRTGWFGSLYALIVLMNLCTRIAGNIKARAAVTTAAWSMALIVISQLAGTAVLQWQRGADHRRFEEAYLASPDGTVYLDHMRDSELPWWTLGRTRGVPDPDDVYLMECFSYSTDYDAPYPIVLPADAAGALPAAGDSIKLSSGDIITDVLPADARPHPMKPGRPQLYIYRNTDGTLWTAQTYHRDGRTLYHLAPLILDPGDRLEGPVFEGM